MTLVNGATSICVEMFIFIFSDKQAIFFKDILVFQGQITLY